MLLECTVHAIFSNDNLKHPANDRPGIYRYCMHKILNFLWNLSVIFKISSLLLYFYLKKPDRKTLEKSDRIDRVSLVENRKQKRLTKI